METGANLVALHAHNDRWGLGPIETINSGHNDAVVIEKKRQMRAGTHRDL